MSLNLVLPNRLSRRHLLETRHSCMPLHIISHDVTDREESRPSPPPGSGRGPVADVVLVDHVPGQTNHASPPTAPVLTTARVSSPPPPIHLQSLGASGVPHAVPRAGPTAPRAASSAAAGRAAPDARLGLTSRPRGGWSQFSPRPSRQPPRPHGSAAEARPVWKSGGAAAAGPALQAADV